MLILAAVLVALTQLVCTMVLCAFIRRYTEQKQREITQRINETIHQFVDPKGEGQGSPLAEMIAAMGHTIGLEAANQFARHLSGSNSHASRVAGGAADLIEAKSNPNMALMALLGKGKGGGVARLLQILAPFLQRGGDGQARTSAGLTDVGERLK